VDSFALLNLAVVRSQQGRHAEAEELLRQADSLFPGEILIRANLAKQLALMGQHEQALLTATSVIEREPHNAETWTVASHVLANMGRGVEAERHARRALDLRPQDLSGWRALVKGLFLQGRVAEAIEACRGAIKIDDRQDTFRLSLAFAMIYDEHARPQDLMAVAREFGQRLEARASPYRSPHRHSPIPGRRIRVGFLSPDLRNHSVMYFAEPLVAGLPRDAFEVYCYLTYPHQDPVTDRVRLLSDNFRVLSLKDPRTAAAIIRDDEVDVLIDLAGHTGHSGLPVMAFRPAPVQATWLGYPATTGLASIDWRISDHYGDPQGADVFYSEKLVRLPGCFAVYRPHIRDPFQRFDELYGVVASPAERQGVVTFGSCNNLAKVSDRCIAAWCRILHAVPNSRLLIEGKDLDRAAARARLREQFNQHGIGEDRLWYVGRDPRQQYLTYHDIDIALDTFPLTGGTTTFDALWMGVPVVTLVGQVFRERLSGTILASGGFVQELCENVDDYVARAVELASNLPALAKRRDGQRQQMQASSLMDEGAFCAKFGRAIRLIWEHWCSQQSFGGIAVSATNDHLAAHHLIEDVLLVPVNGRRVTLRDARLWLAQLQERLRAARVPEDIESARALALAIMWVRPDDTLAAEVARETADWRPTRESDLPADLGSPLDHYAREATQ
jgi:predicted O-linked N-acetylglucosamine transferase (SPINDLY family)